MMRGYSHKWPSVAESVKLFSWPLASKLSIDLIIYVVARQIVKQRADQVVSDSSK